MKNSPQLDCPPRELSRLAARRHDVLIIGGGINGAGLARDLALRGLAVVLVDQGDFASGTSSASTRLIHGGLRYLQHLDFRLVLESCRERAVLQRIAPHLVRPQSLLIPVYRDDPHSLLAIRAGLSLYDLLAWFRAPRRHRMLDAEAATSLEPALRPQGLRGAALYWDCRTDDARLCLENVLAAAGAGAQTVNYLAAVGMVKAGGKVVGARLRDQETGEEIDLEATVVVNATGPWLERICALDGDPTPKLRPTRGSHILVPRINRG
ncbi:MAG: FAD-dependent oxidoreductase, partial [Desulfuromonadales bacterium]|nr:FAD-dependent oxidoreductase [Desulfuromonadales bacterium]